MNKVFTIIAFIAGAIAGSAATYTVVKREARKEIEAIKDEYFEKVRIIDTLLEQNDKFEDASEEKLKADAVSDDDFTNYSGITKNYKKEEEEAPVSKIYIIEPEEFGEAGYPQVFLTHYADGILADDYDEIIDDPEEVVGYGYQDHIGEYEADVLHVRNDDLECDYEITRDLRKYEDVSG